MSASIFWDFENCSIPDNHTGQSVCDQVQKFTRVRSWKLFQFHAIGNLRKLKPSDIQQLEDNSVLIQHVSSRKPNATDMVIINRIMSCTELKPPHYIILISGDGDFAQTAATVKGRCAGVIVITCHQHSTKLSRSVEEVYYWNDFLNMQFQINTISYDQLQLAIGVLEQRFPNKSISEVGRIVRSGAIKDYEPRMEQGHFQSLKNLHSERSIKKTRRFTKKRNITSYSNKEVPLGAELIVSKAFATNASAREDPLQWKMVMKPLPTEIIDLCSSSDESTPQTFKRLTEISTKSQMEPINLASDSENSPVQQEFEFVFIYQKPANTVSVSGSWDDWDSETVLNNNNGIFSITKSFGIGQYIFDFTVDGKNDIDRNNYFFLETGNGEFNYFSVTQQGIVGGYVDSLTVTNQANFNNKRHPNFVDSNIFQQCTLERKVASAGNQIEYSIIVRGEIDSPLYLVGSWDNWSSAIKFLKKDDHYVVNIHLAAGTYYYRFICNGITTIDSNLPVAKMIENRPPWGLPGSVNVIQVNS